ncbi:MAG TPA: hemerythrin domain-containing protein [Kineosporiaceae bacterium]|nr:hemerythrin domain-containing protein [Kineosporiaceae bacterium]
MAASAHASPTTNARAAAAIRSHHAELTGALQQAVTTLLDAVDGGDPAGIRDATEHVVGWCERELLPHAAAEEETLYPAAASQEPARLLITSMTAEHELISRLVRELAASDRPISSVATAGALQVVFASHVGKENDLVLPLLESASGTGLADLLEAMHHRNPTPRENPVS